MVKSGSASSTSSPHRVIPVCQAHGLSMRARRLTSGAFSPICSPVGGQNRYCLDRNAFGFRLPSIRNTRMRTNVAAPFFVCLGRATCRIHWCLALGSVWRCGGKRSAGRWAWSRESPGSVRDARGVVVWRVARGVRPLGAWASWPRRRARPRWRWRISESPGSRGRRRRRGRGVR